jgi:hypothetical protein
LERIGGYAFSWSGLKSIEIPRSVVDLGEESFFGCLALGSVGFQNDSRSERIDKSAFQCSGLKAIVIPSSVIGLGKDCFCCCKSLESAVTESGLKWIAITPSVTFMNDS